MTVDEIETAARHGSDLPGSLTQPEQLLFLSFRYLYAQYRIGSITRDQASIEKKRLLHEFEMANFRYEMFMETAKMRNRLSAYLTEIEKGGCDKCRLAVKIFDGRKT